MKTQPYKSDIELLTEMAEHMKTISRKLTEISNQREFDFVDGPEMQELLHISDRTLIEWRKQGLIKGAKMGKKIFYSLSETEKLMREKMKEAA